MKSRKTKRKATMLNTIEKEAHDWLEWEHQLDLKRVGAKQWTAIGPSGNRIAVKPTFINGIPSIAYEENGRIMATPVPSLDPKVITRGGIVDKKSWEFSIIETVRDLRKELVSE